jgi:hypothetical protein
MGRREEVSAVWVSWQGRSTSRRGWTRAGVRARRMRLGEGDVLESSACGGVCDNGVCLARLRRREERTGGVGARRGCVRVCECVDAGG